MPWNKFWKIDHDQKVVRLSGDSIEARRDAIDGVLDKAKNQAIFKVLNKWTGERFPVFGPGRELIADLERAAATLFGIVTYGVHLIVYREEEAGQLSIWLARRSAQKVLHPNKLGVTVGGSLSAGETPSECVIREAQEEASLPADVVSAAIKSVGSLSYVTSSETKSTSGGEAGLIRPEIQYLYEMKVNEDVVPTPFDNEASDISLYSIEEIRKSLFSGDWTPANACIMLDFFIRHGLITYETEEKYNEILTRLHRPLGIQSA